MRFKIVWVPRQDPWQKWFAWWPVKVPYGYDSTGRPMYCWVWLETVEYRRGYDPHRLQYLLVGESIWLWDVREAGNAQLK